VSSLQAPLLGKRLELLKETLPATRRVAVFWDSFSRGQLIDVEASALALDIQVRPIEVKSSSELSRALSRAKEETDAGLFLFSPMFFQLREKIASEAERVKLPTAFQEAWFTAAGGLLSYGADINEAMRRVAYLVDRLLKGSRPSDLPVEQIAKLHLAVNLKTAEDLGVTIPQSVLLRADEIVR
jgi:putative ABC transport system substrate-binding protein